MSQLKVTILGCGSATPTARHSPTAQVVELNDRLYLVDCGEGTQFQMRKYGIRFSRLNHFFISHAHGDHCFGLPGLIASLNLLGRKGDLTIHCSSGTESFLSFVLAQFGKEMTYKVIVNVIDTYKHQLVMEDRSVAVYSIPLKHRIPTCGFLFEEKPREPHIVREMIDFYHVPLSKIAEIKMGKDFVASDGTIVPYTQLTRPAAPPKRYAFCSDTGFSPAIVPYIEGVDCLYHEATYLDADMPRAKETFHSTAQQAAEIASRAGVKHLVLGHYSARYKEITAFYEEAERLFPNVTLAMEGLTVVV